MDGDGEDSPNNIINSDVALEKKCIIIASRKEDMNCVFQNFLFLYCLLFFINGTENEFWNFGYHVFLRHFQS